MMLSRVLLIGQAPGPNTDPELPLFPVPRTSAGARLQELMGVSRTDYLYLFERINLLNTFPGRQKRDDKFPMASARIAASAVRPLLHGRTVVLVGRNVANAFGIEADFHDWIEWPLPGSGICQLAVVPHPSGRNHWYNCEQNRRAARRFWRALIKNMTEAEENILSFAPEGL